MSFVTRLASRLRLSQMFSSCSPSFPHRVCVDMCSWGILSPANDPISTSGVGGIRACLGVGSGVGGLMMRQLT